MNYDKIKEMDFRRRLRVVVNLLKNSRNEVVDTPNGDAGNRMPANLRQVENIILSGEIADSIMIDNDVRQNFNVIQMEEERQKLQFTKEHPEHSAGLFSWRITICFKVVQIFAGDDKPARGGMRRLKKLNADHIVLCWILWQKTPPRCGT